VPQRQVQEEAEPIEIDPFAFLRMVHGIWQESGLRKGAFAASVGLRENYLNRLFDKNGQPVANPPKTLPRGNTLVGMAVRLKMLVDELLVGVNPEYDRVRSARLTTLVQQEIQKQRNKPDLERRTQPVPGSPEPHSSLNEAATEPPRAEGTPMDWRQRAITALTEGMYDPKLGKLAREMASQLMLADRGDLRDGTSDAPST